MSLGALNKETKDLYVEVKANEAKYVSGELDLRPSLEKTDQLYIQSIGNQIEGPTAARVIQDSGLLQLQASIARQCAKSYSLDALKFDARKFTINVRNHLCPNMTDDDEKSLRNNKKSLVTLWEKLGQHAKDTMHIVPTFNFIYGTFDVDTKTPVKKQRRKIVRDKVGDLTRPEEVNIDGFKEEDVMLAAAENVLSYFISYTEKKGRDAICFYEFVTDPKSFTRTVENIFLVSLLVKEGYLCMFPDDQGLPCLKDIRKEKANYEGAVAQSVISLTMEDWKDIVQTFGFKEALIQPRKKTR